MPPKDFAAAIESLNRTVHDLPGAIAQATRALPQDGETNGQDDAMENRGQRRAQYMRYYRSVRSPNCPQAIRDLFNAANNATGKESQRKLQELFDEFKRCNEDWSVSSIVLEESRSHATSHTGLWKWVTREDS